MTQRTVGYRPYWSGVCPYGAQGVIAELNLARSLMKMPRYVRGPRDEPAIGTSPLVNGVKSVESLQELFEALEFDQEERNKKIKGVT